jgi:phosphoribosylformylglycinamidine cyclo-ligase
MNVNDLICCGARPLFFLDYFACGKLNVNTAEQVISGIMKGCALAGCSLIGGETAEMPGFYPPGEYDLAGFAVGVIEKGREITGKNIRPGDAVIGLPSSGPHSNGYSLIRKVFNKKELKKYSKELLAPTRIYVKDLLPLLQTSNFKLRTAVHGLAHITGGSFHDKIERILPKNCRVAIDKDSWDVPEIFRLIQKKGKIPDKEIYRVLNMGIGMVLIVRKKESERVKKMLKGARIIGWVEKGKRGVELI